MTRRTGSPRVDRDQLETAFSGPLVRLCDALRAGGVALVDREGETVDYAGFLPPFEIRVAAAEWRLILNLLEQSRASAWRTTTELRFRGARRSYAVVRLEEGYALVIVLSRYRFAISPRAVDEAVRDVSFEAGLKLPRAPRSGRDHWIQVDVRSEGHPSRRPVAVCHQGTWRDVQVLGSFSVAGSESRAIGFRAQLKTGEEVTLVREPFGRWYIDTLARDLPGSECQAISRTVSREESP